VDGVKPISITAVLVKALKATPQLRQEPPEKPAVELALLFRVLLNVEPVMMYTFVPLSTQAVCPVTEFDEQEFTTPGVAIEIGAAGVGSIRTT